MDFTYSPQATAARNQALHDAYQTLVEAINGNAQAQEAAKLLANCIPALASGAPGQSIHAVIDNLAVSPDPIYGKAVDDIDCANVSGTSCSPGPFVVLGAEQQSDPPLAPPPTSINASRKALIIENDKSLRRMFKARLENRGFVVRSACNGEAGLRLYDDCSPFFVVLINYYVSKNGLEGGVELASAIRRRNPSQPIVIAALDFQHEEDVPLPTQLIDVPVLINVRQLRTVLDKLQYWATRDEVDQAIGMLSNAELLKLQRFAECRARGLGRAALGNSEDLLQEALLKTLQGAETNGGRRWNKNVDFITHLTGVIRSISYHRRTKFKKFHESETYLESEITGLDADGQVFSPLDSTPSGDTATDEALIANETANEGAHRLLRAFEKDSQAMRVLQGWLEGMDRDEVVQKHGLTEKEYMAVMKRIRVKVLRHSARRRGGREYGE